MTKSRKDMEPTEGLSNEELEAQQGEQLPDREQMSLINANFSAPVNAAVALNVLSDSSTAYANAIQTNEIIQHNYSFRGGSRMTEMQRNLEASEGLSKEE